MTKRNISYGILLNGLNVTTYLAFSSFLNLAHLPCFLQLDSTVNTLLRVLHEVVFINFANCWIIFLALPVERKLTLFVNILIQTVVLVWSEQNLKINVYQ